MGHKKYTLVVLLALAVLSTAVTLVDIQNVIIRLILTLPLVFITPGYALVAALFPQRSLGGAQTFGFSVGASLAINVLTGLVLNLTPWGLQAVSWAIMLCGIALLAGAATIVRGPRVSPFTERGPRFVLGYRNATLIVLSLALAVGAIVVARAGAFQQHDDGFTLFWMLPKKDATTPGVELGLQSMETQQTAYHVKLMLNGSTVHEWPSIQLEPNQQWQALVRIPTASGPSGPLEAVLYRLDSPAQVYRRVLLQSIR